MSAPPKGYRPAIPVKAKFEAVLRQEGRCSRCGEKIQNWADMQLDHRPPLQMRSWDPETEDTVPPANDPNHLDALHKDCHAVRTTGRRGESDLSKRGGDVSEIAKLRRVEKKHEAFRNRLLTKSTDSDESEETIKTKKPKRVWPSRPFPSGKKRQKHGHEEK